MYRAFLLSLYLFAVAIAAKAQEQLQVGNIYFGVVVYSESFNDAELLAAGYLLRGNVKTLPEENKKKYHCEVGTMIFTIIETMEFLTSGNGETLYIIKALSTKTIYIVSPTPALPRKPSKHNSRDDPGVPILYNSNQSSPPFSTENVQRSSS